MAAIVSLCHQVSEALKNPKELIHSFGGPKGGLPFLPLSEAGYREMVYHPVASIGNNEDSIINLWLADWDAIN